MAEEARRSADDEQRLAVRGRRSLWRCFIRTFFRLLYHELAWTYDLVAWLVSFGQWKAWGRAAIPHLCGRRVLELAHGPGHLLVAMHRAGFAPVGLDLSPQMGGLAKKRWERARVARPSSTPTPLPLPNLGEGGGRGRERAPLVRARAQALPFRSGAFDSVVSTFPTEFIVASATLQEIARVMTLEGCAVVVPGITFKRTMPARCLEWLYTVTGQQEPVPPGLADALAEAGLTLKTRRVPMGMVDVIVGVARKR